MQTNIHTDTHTHMYAHTHTHAHNNTHTHTQSIHTHTYTHSQYTQSIHTCCVKTGVRYVWHQQKDCMISPARKTTHSRPVIQTDVTAALLESQ